MNETRFYDIDISCVHCGQSLSARNIEDGGIHIKGLRALEYRHTVSKSKQCTTTHAAQPYDGWIATKAYEKASL